MRFISQYVRVEPSLWIWPFYFLKAAFLVPCEYAFAAHIRPYTLNHLIAQSH